MIKLMGLEMEVGQKANFFLIIFGNQTFRSRNVLKSFMEVYACILDFATDFLLKVSCKIRNSGMLYLLDSSGF